MTRVVVTRAAHQAEELAEPLRANGFTVLLVPMIGIAPPADPEPLSRAAQSCNDYDWIIFTSVNAVNAFAAAGARVEVPVAAIGPATRKAAEQQAWRVAMTPESYVAESLVAAFSQYHLANSRILIPSAAITRDTVAPALRKYGARVDVVEAYKNVAPEEAGERSKEVFREPYPDWVTFASTSAVENLVAVIGADQLRRVRIASIGPITSAAVRKCGLTVAAEPDEHTIPGLVDALVRACSP
ncbi:MAG TPA: uroporphyrinogen-III synthase [Bryobacteraceae bacterium]|jgi:uroporphyrinogen-III synthase|nr:uroporphyrinogen-III synthase [Bryobacteraceae bacterium]